MMDDKELKKELTPPEEKKKNKRKYMILLLLFAFLTTISVSFILQHNTEDPIVIDNIPIEPAKARTIHVSGRVLYEDDTPYKKGDVHLHSEVRKTKTDETGWFLFENVSAEKHTLKVVDKNEKVVAEAVINVNQIEKKEMIDIEKKSKGNYVINVPYVIRYLELSLQVSDDKLIIVEEKTYAICDEGKIHTTTGIITTEDGATVLESGTVLTEGNMIIHHPLAIDSENKIHHIDENGKTLPDGTNVDSNGNITLPNGTVINSNDKTVTPPHHSDNTNNGNDSNNVEQTIPNDTPSHIDPDGNVKPVVPVKPEDNNDSDNSDKPVNPDKPVDPDMPVEPDKPVDPDKPVNPDEPDNPDPEPQPDPDKGEGYIYRNADVGWSDQWTGNLSVDLFGSENAKIQPGSHGRFLFRVENKRQSDLKLIMQIMQYDSYELPLRFRLGSLKTVSDNLPKNLKWQTWNKDNTIQLVTDKDTIGSMTSGNNSIIYCMEWEWPYESGNDKQDTNAGIKAGQYALDLKIRLEDTKSL